jgi:spore coat protein U-like protein
LSRVARASGDPVTRYPQRTPRFVRRAVVVLCLALFLWRPGAAEAASCTISVAAMNLGVYTGALSTTGTTTVTVTCTPGFNYSILMGFGNGSGATQTVHKVTGPSANTLQYNMFRNSTRTLNWGQTPPTDTVNATGTGSAQTFSIYPRMPAGQSGLPGTYTDQVLIAVSGFGVYRSTTFTVTATILPSCTLTSASLSFGNYADIVNDASAILTVRCSNGTPYNVGLSAGTAPGATVSTRKMTGPGSALLNYNLFRNTGRTINWGNTIGTDTQTGTGSGANQSVYIYGRLPAQQRVTPGTYADTVVATITY